MNYRILLIFCLSILVNSCGNKTGKEYFSLGEAKQQEGNYEASIPFFTKGIAVNDEFKFLNYYGRGSSYHKLEKYDQALEDYEEVLKTERSNPKIYNSFVYWDLAWIAEQKGERMKELQLYRKALKYDPTNKKLKMTYALNLIEVERYNDGVKILDELIEEEFQHPYLFSNRALGLIHLNRFDEATLDLEKAKEQDPDNPFVYRNYFFLYRGLGNLPLACENINKALSLDIIEYGVRKHIQDFKDLRLEYCN